MVYWFYQGDRVRRSTSNLKKETAMNTSKQGKVFGGFRVSADGRVFVSDLALLQEVRAEADRQPVTPPVGSSTANPHYSVF